MKLTIFIIVCGFVMTTDQIGFYGEWAAIFVSGGVWFWGLLTDDRRRQG